MRCVETEMSILFMFEMRNTASSPQSQMLTSPEHPWLYAEQRDLELSISSTD